MRSILVSSIMFIGVVVRSLLYVRVRFDRNIELLQTPVISEVPKLEMQYGSFVT